MRGRGREGLGRGGGGETWRKDRGTEQTQKENKERIKKRSGKKKGGNLGAKQVKKKKKRDSAYPTNTF